MPQIRLTGAQALLRALRAEDVRDFFGVVGGKLAPLLKALADDPALRFHGVRHEAAGPLMAAATWAGTGRLAVALGEMGPGALNVAAGLGTGFNNNLPLLAVTTNQHRAASYPHKGMFMDLDTLAVLRPLVKWNAVVQDGRRLPELVRRAFREALTGRPGPVHLDIPQDVLAGTWDFADDEFALAPARYRPTRGPRPCADDVREAAALLRGAARPLVVAGGGAVAAGAIAEIRALAALLDAPVVPTQMALGAVATGSRHHIGHGGLIGGDALLAACREADVVIAFGCRFSSWMWDANGPLVGRGQALINVNTDASALGEPALHAVAMQADARLAVADLHAALQQPAAAPRDPAWLDGLQARHAACRARLDALADDAGDPMHPAALARAIGRALPADALAVFDGGHTSFWSNDFTPVAEPRTRLHEPGMSLLGFGLAYAIALQLAHPGRAVVNITGDGAFGFTLQELDTARRLRTPVVNIIHNNAAWGIIRQGQRQLGFELGTALEETDYAAIARGFGGHGETVTAPEQLAPALSRALASGLPAVIDCRVRFEPHPALPAFGSMNRYGFGALTRA
jgi:thiamine pyrophosphate-dependent acetolactate synthase large subunit-like protein